MTVLTNDGRSYLDDLQFGRTTDPINAIAVGTGSAPESIQDSQLDNQVYISTAENANVRFSPVPDYPSSTYAAIDLHGGTEVPAGTEITEIGLFVGAQNILVYRDVTAPVTVESGLEVTRRLRVNTTR